MKVSSRGEYGCLAVLDLARAYYRKELLNLKTIARAHQIPEPYLVQILSQLQSAGIVASQRGAQGGYFLTRSPKEITLGQVIRTTDGPSVVAKCLENEAFSSHPKAPPCVFREIWLKVQEAVDSIVDQVTFDHLLKRQTQIQEKTHAKA